MTRNTALEAALHPNGVSTPAAPSAKLSEAVIDAAIGWAVKLDYGQPTPSLRQAFEQWLHASPAHALAWQRVHTLKTSSPTLSGLPAQLALDTLQAADTARRAHARQGRRNALKALSLAGVAVAAGWVAYDHAPWQQLLAQASTSTGEQTTLRLDDGTVIVLNTNTAVSTDLKGAQRLILLHKGEILITTGADAAAQAHYQGKRPFWVHTPFGTIQALGTRFVVRLEGPRARVSVQEGAVELHPALGGATAIAHAGQSLWLTSNAILPAAAQGFSDDGWADGVIAGNNIRMADLVAELARYRPGRSICDERVANLRVSGIFHINDTDQALRFLEQTQPISVTYRTRYWVTVGPAAHGARR
ncbi:MAG: FecR domain-containing protein [Pusillimonas sp.]